MRSAVILFALLVGVAGVSAHAVELSLDVTFEGGKVLDGDADQQLKEIGRRAADENLALEVRAPDLWKSRVLQPIRDGVGKADVKIEFVNVLAKEVRVRGLPADQAEDPIETLKRITSGAKAHAAGIDQSAQESAPAPRSVPESGSEAASERPDMKQPDLDMPKVKVKRPSAHLPDVSEAARDSISDSSDDPEGGPRRAGESRAAEPPAAGDVNAGGAAGENAGSAAEERKLFERLYNDARDIDRTLTPEQLEEGDLVFSGQFMNVVVRRKISTDAYWLQGALPMERLRHDERNRYTVMAEAHPEGPEAPAAVSPGQPDERTRMERLYNGGREITDTMAAADLRPDDEIYSGEGVNVVVRRAAIGRRAYWLAGDVSLKQPGIEHESKNRYIVVGQVE